MCNATATVPDALESATPVERADVEVTRAVADWRHAAPVRWLGKLSELADQPPLISLCAATLVVGLAGRDWRLARAGGRMLAAELVATKLKGIVKDRVDRTRPTVLVEEGRYRAEPGNSHDGDERSFPSGHTAGAVAVARALAREYPGSRRRGLGAATAVALIQIPRCTHFPSDIGAGAAIGWASELIVDRAARLAGRFWARRSASA